MSHPFDATLKDLLGQAPNDLRKAFHLPTLEPAQTLNVDLSTISAATDVAIGFGEPVQEIADLNFQSGPDRHVAARLLLYNAAFYLKFGVPVRSILVLLRPKADTPGLTGKLSYASGGNAVTFEYEVIRLWTEPVELFLDGPLGLAPLAMLCKKPAGKPLAEGLRTIVHEIDRRLVAASDRGQAVRLMTATFILTGLRVPRSRLRSIFEGVKIMHETTAWDEVEIGINSRILRRLGKQRFGEPDAKTETALASIVDVDRLERMIDSILSVKSWKALLAIK